MPPRVFPQMAIEAPWFRAKERKSSITPCVIGKDAFAAFLAVSHGDAIWYDLPKNRNGWAKHLLDLQGKPPVKIGPQIRFGNENPGYVKGRI